LEGGSEPTEAIGDYLHYVVNFENTGNMAASFVVINQQIDETMFDMDSFQLLSSSHAMDATVTGNNIKFRFDDINLGPHETGSVVYKVKSQGLLQPGDEVLNKASIVFDYNIPLPTNEASTVFEDVMSVESPDADSSVNVYPNPAKDILNISAANNLKSVQLYDLQGRLLEVAPVDAKNTSINVSSRAHGMYFLKIITEKGSKVEKVIKE
jgi:uncharacterized repeat protein (TIGR01451 family)